MKLNPFCLCCILNKQEKLIRSYPDMDKKTEYMKKLMALIANTKETDCAPSLSVDIQKLYSSFWNCPAEDYTEVKKDFNRFMLDIEHTLEEKIRSSADPLEKALLYARIGNYIDFAALSNVNQETALTLLENNSDSLDQERIQHFP